MTENIKKPAISLVILTYNRPEGLRRCLDSISHMQKDNISYEIVVVDDGSSVDNESVIKKFLYSFPIRYIKKQHGGVASARNLGIRESHGEKVAFIADDYRLPRNYLVDVINFFEKHKDAYVITHNIKATGPSIFRYVQRLYFEMTLLQRFDAEDIKSEVVNSFELPPSRAAVFRREIFNLIGYFNDEFLTGEDGEFGMRMASQNIPVYFFPHKYIEHWEDMDLWGYLDQRVRYGRSNFKVLGVHDSPSHLIFTFTGTMKSVLKKYLSWLELSRAIGRSTEYSALSPLVIVFLIFHYYAHYIEYRKFKNLSENNHVTS
jgi:glycosyltransferase involved in cell wall biosynthesis